MSHGDYNTGWVMEILTVEFIIYSQLVGLIMDNQIKRAVGSCPTGNSYCYLIVRIVGMSTGPVMDQVPIVLDKHRPENVTQPVLRGSVLTDVKCPKRWVFPAGQCTAEIHLPPEKVFLTFTPGALGSVLIRSWRQSAPLAHLV